MTNEERMFEKHRSKCPWYYVSSTRDPETDNKIIIELCSPASTNRNICFMSQEDIIDSMELCDFEDCPFMFWFTVTRNGRF